MTRVNFSSELERALARPDADRLTRQVQAYIEHIQGVNDAWPDEVADDFSEIVMSGLVDPDLALAYTMIAASITDDEKFLGFMGAGGLEEILRDPSDELLSRIVDEARRTARFRWLLSCPYPHAIAPRAWEAIKDFVTFDANSSSVPPRPSA